MEHRKGKVKRPSSSRELGAGRREEKWPSHGKREKEKKTYFIIRQLDPDLTLRIGTKLPSIQILDGLFRILERRKRDISHPFRFLAFLYSNKRTMVVGLVHEPDGQVRSKEVGGGKVKTARKDRTQRTLSLTTNPFLTGPMNEKWVIKSVVVVSYGREETNTVILNDHKEEEEKHRSATRNSYR